MTGLPLAGAVLAVAVLVSPRRVRYLSRKSVAPTHIWHRIALIAALLGVAGASVWISEALLLVGLICGAVFTAWRRRRRAELRRSEESRAMASALEVLIGELAVGAHPVRAFAVAAAESPGVVGLALDRVAARARLGADVTAGLRGAEQGSAVPAYWRRLAACWELAAQRGLAMSVLMRAAHQDIVERQRFSDRVRAALAGARATAAILAGLPLGGVLLGQLIGAHPVRFLLGGGLGGVLLVVGVALIAAGLAWAERIIERLLA